jgi:hypothetical protein
MVMDEPILRDQDIETRSVPMRPARGGARPRREAGYSYDDLGEEWKEIDAGGVVYRELTETPPADATIDDLDTYRWRLDSLDLYRYVGAAEKAKHRPHETDYALVGLPGFSRVWEWPIPTRLRAHAGKPALGS